jgi:hypothetical protein
VFVQVAARSAGVRFPAAKKYTCIDNTHVTSELIRRLFGDKYQLYSFIKIFFIALDPCEI